MSYSFILLFIGVLFFLSAWKEALETRTKDGQKGTLSNTSVVAVLFIVVAAMMLQLGENYYRGQEVQALQETIRIQEETIEIYEENAKNVENGT